MGINYQTDTPESVYSEFIRLENEIEQIGRNIKKLAVAAETASANYELAKNQTLLLLYAEESGNPEQDIKPFKRTEAHREAIYRTEHANLRLLRGITSSDLRSEQDLLKALITTISGLQSRKGLILIGYEKGLGQGAT